MFIKNGKVIAISKVTTDNTTLSGTGLPGDPLQVIGGAGERGPKGDKGDPGVGIKEVITTETEKGADIQFELTDGSKSDIFTVYDGSTGYTPVVSSKEASKTDDHKNGGIKVTYTYPSEAKIDPITYTIWHGNDADIAGLSATISNEYAKKSEIPTAVSELENDVGYITTAALNGYAKSTDIPTNVSQLENDSNFTTMTAVEAKGYITNDALNGYLTKTSADTIYQPIGDYALKSDVPSLDGYLTKISADTIYQPIGNYITSADADATYAKKTDIPDVQDFATKEYVDDIANELSAAISAIEPEFELSAVGVAGIMSEYDPDTHTIYTALTGISGTSGVSVKFDEDNDCWIISADKDQITDTYFAGEYQSLNGISTDTTFTYNATASSSNITVLDDGVIIIKNQTNTSTPTKLTFNINEAITGEIDYPGWLLNSIALYQGKLPDEAIIENEDGTITIDTDNYGEDGWTIEWHNTPIWQCGDYYAAECGLSELTFGYTVENGTKTCCYKVVYKGDETNQGNDDTARVISKISIVAAAESLNSGSSTPEIIEIESRLDNIEDTLNSKLLNTLSISSVDDISYLQNNQTTVHLTLFKPDMNFTLSNSTKIKCYIDRIDYIPDTNALCSFVLYKLADDGISAKLIAMSNELSGELRRVKSQNEKDLTFTLRWINPEEETELSSNTMYYAGFFFNFGAILMGGNTINWSLSNFNPYLTFIRDNMTEVTSYNDIREYFTNLRIDNTGGGRVSTYRVFFELNNKGLGN